MKLPISLIVITLNEEKNIERCLRSAPFASDILVLDSGSQDRTLEIAKRLGARTLQEPWRGYARQKIRATALARNDWVLSLDADEALSEAAKTEILSLFKNIEQNPDELNNVDAFSFPRRANYLGRWMLHGGMYPDRQTRLYNRARAQWIESSVHEKIEAKHVRALHGDILHWPFATLSDQIETIDRYSGLRAGELAKSGAKYSPVKLIRKTIVKFFEAYVLKRGFQDGQEGLIAAMVSAFATFLRWAKLRELQITGNSSSSQNGTKD